VFTILFLFCRFDFKGIIDYIFYSKQSMTPLGLLGPLASEWLRENKVVGCPHPHVPSGKSAHFSAFGVIHSNKVSSTDRSIQGLPVVKVSTSGFNSRADGESKMSYTHRSNSQQFRSYEFVKYSK